MAEAVGPSVTSPFQIFKGLEEVSRPIFTATGFYRLFNSSFVERFYRFLETRSNVPSCELQVRPSLNCSSRLGAAEGRGSSDGVEYSYTLSSHLWYGVYEVTVSVRAVRILTFVSAAVAHTPLCVRCGESEDNVRRL